MASIEELVKQFSSGDSPTESLTFNCMYTKDLNKKESNRRNHDGFLLIEPSTRKISVFYNENDSMGQSLGVKTLNEHEWDLEFEKCYIPMPGLILDYEDCKHNFVPFKNSNAGGGNRNTVVSSSNSKPTGKRFQCPSQSSASRSSFKQPVRSDRGKFDFERSQYVREKYNQPPAGTVVASQKENTVPRQEHEPESFKLLRKKPSEKNVPSIVSKSNEQQQQSSLPLSREELLQQEFEELNAAKKPRTEEEIKAVLKTLRSECS